MGTSEQARSRRQELGLLVALIAVLLAPVSVPSAVAAPAENPPLTSSFSDEVASGVQGSSEVSRADPGRTVTVLASILAVTGIAALLWWAIVIRRRGD